MAKKIKENRKTFLIFLLLVVLLAVFIASLGFGRYPIRIKEIVGIFASKITHVEPFWQSSAEDILFRVRLPRIVLACLVGASLSVAGASYQGIFQNPMASPDILGTSAGASFGAALAIMLFAHREAVALGAFVAGMASIAFVFLVSRKAKGNRILGLVLSGIMVSSLFTAGVSYLKLVADPADQLPSITYWLMGSLASTDVSDLKFALVPMLIGMLPLFLLRWQINALTMGEEEAKTMGVNTGVVRITVILCATLITAASVSVSGVIGWVGLVIPHLCRRVVGNNYQYLLPASLIGGALFLLCVDNISRNALNTEIPIGILTAVIGAPFFMYLLTRKEEQY